MSEVVVIRCPMVEHPTLGKVRVPLKLPSRPNLTSDRDRDALILQFLGAYADLQRQHGGPALPTGVDPDWKLAEVPAEQADVNAGATVCLELSRDAPLVIPDPGFAHRARALSGAPALAGEVPGSPMAPAPPQPGQPQPPPAPAPPAVLGPGELPPPAAAPPAQPAGPAPDIRPAGCGGSACVIVNGVEAHEPATCPEGSKE